MSSRKREPTLSPITGTPNKRRKTQLPKNTNPFAPQSSSLTPILDGLALTPSHKPQSSNTILSALFHPTTQSNTSNIPSNSYKSSPSKPITSAFFQFGYPENKKKEHAMSISPLILPMSHNDTTNNYSTINNHNCNKSTRYQSFNNHNNNNNNINQNFGSSRNITQPKRQYRSNINDENSNNNIINNISNENSNNNINNTSISNENNMKLSFEHVMDKTCAVAANMSAKTGQKIEINVNYNQHVETVQIVKQQVVNNFQSMKLCKHNRKKKCGRCKSEINCTNDGWFRVKYIKDHWKTKKCKRAGGSRAMQCCNTKYYYKRSGKTTHSNNITAFYKHCIQHELGLGVEDDDTDPDEY